MKGLEAASAGSAGRETEVGLPYQSRHQRRPVAQRPRVADAAAGAGAAHGPRRVSPQENYPQVRPIYEFEEGENPLLRNGEPPSSDSEAGANTSKTDPLRNPKQDRTEVLKYSYKKSVRTEAHARAHPHLRLPERFLALRDEQQAGALVALQQVQVEQRQAVLDEWAARCRSSAVRKPAGYLFGIIQAAIRGKFNAWAGKDKR